MNNSKKVKHKILLNKLVSLVFTILAIYIIYNIILDLIPLLDKWVVIVIYSFFVISLIIFLIYYINGLDKFTRNKEIFYELDNNIDKVFEKFGLYITKNYIICTGSKIDFITMFAVKIKDIDAIDTHNDSRYYYKKKCNKSKGNILSFIKSSIKTDIMFGNNDRAVFNIICGKSVYCIATSSYLNKYKIKKINEIADYICDKYKDIDYI